MQKRGYVWRFAGLPIDRTKTRHWHTGGHRACEAKSLLQERQPLYSSQLLEYNASGIRQTISYHLHRALMWQLLEKRNNGLCQHLWGWIHLCIILNTIGITFPSKTPSNKIKAQSVKRNWFPEICCLKPQFCPQSQRRIPLDTESPRNHEMCFCIGLTHLPFMLLSLIISFWHWLPY